MPGMGSPKGPQRIELKDLGQKLKNGGLIEVRFTNTDGRTEVWMIPEDIQIEAESRTLDHFRDHVKLAYLDYGVDARLGLQRDRLDLMLRHIQHHEAELSDGGSTPPYVCTFAETLPDGSTPK